MTTDWESYSEALADHVEAILNHFGVDYKESHKYYYSTCPIHPDSDNKSAFNLYKSNGYWVCRTHECQKVFGTNLFGLVRGLLSNKKGWAEKENKQKEATNAETISFIRKLTNVEPGRFELEEEDIEKRKFAKSAPIKLEKIHSNITREQVRASLIIPPEYYLRRGFSPQILDEYDVGLCLDIDSPLYKRVLCPIYNSDYRAIGFTGRSIYEKCYKCSYYHNHQLMCPEPQYRHIYSKWKNCKNLDKGRCLYNLWKAHTVIKSTGLAILTESPGNVLKLSQAGFYNSLATLGVVLTDYQQALLSACGAMNILVCNDNDKAGNKAVEELVERLQDLYCLRIYTPKTDIGDMTVEEIRKDLGPLIQKLSI